MVEGLARVAALAVCLVVAAANGAFGGDDFGGNSVPLSSHFDSEDGSHDDGTDLASDGAGHLIASWKSNDTSLGITGATAPVISRSSDNGTTWTVPVVPRPEFLDGLGIHPQIATDGSGTWILAWSGDGQQVQVTRSNDNGTTWNAPQTIAPFPGNTFLAMEADGLGTWLLIWSSSNAMAGAIGDVDIAFSRSVDDGASWSAPALLNTDGAVDGRDDDWFPEIATDGAGTWVATWGYFETMVARSTDDGATWEAPVELSAAGVISLTYPEVATDGAGNWLAVWSYYDHTIESSKLSYSRSDDDAATWSVAAPLHPSTGPGRHGDHAEPSALLRSDGQWQVVWGTADFYGVLGTDADVAVSYSRDLGVSWSSPSALTTRARRDGPLNDFEPSIASSSNGRTIVAYSTGKFPTTDVDIHYSTSTRDCDDLAREDCRTSTEPDGSSLKIKDPSSGSDNLTWRLKYAEATSDLDLGAPTISDDYVLCLYEKVAGAPALVAEWDAKAATTCRGVPCWKAEPGSVELRDSGLEQGSIKKLKVRGGADGEASLQVRAGGTALSAPLLPLDATTPVRIQLVNLGTGTCWEGVHDQARRNEDGRFESTSD